MMMKISLMVMVMVVRSEEAPTVRTESGWVSGEVEQIPSGRNVYSYRGIPFAQPPVGRLRFKPPTAKVSWDGVRPSTRDTPICQQVDFFKMIKDIEDVQGSEDCLYLDVYTPYGAMDEGSQKLPVLVYIHGGAFFFGDKNMYGPTRFLEHDVLVVPIQYRLGILGFLSTDDDVVPGNFGLLDQAEALRWVQRNIQQFGGDPDRVTIFGHSAGGASTHYHLLSPLTKGLFSGAMLHSGSGLDPWSGGSSFREVAEKVGRDMGCQDLDHSDALLACLQKVPSKPLTASILQFMELGMDPVKLAPRVDGVFLPAEPAVLVKEGRYQHHIPIMAGYVTHEGCWTTSVVYNNDTVLKKLKDIHKVQLASLELDEKDVGSSDIAARIFKHYMGGPYFGKEHVEEVTQMYGDRLFIYPLEMVSRHYARKSPIYTYELSHIAQHSLSTLFSGMKLPYKWVCHADDLLYTFPGEGLFKPFNFTSPEDLRLANIMVQLMVNYATVRNPTPDDSLGFIWTPQTPANLQYLDLKPNPTMAPNKRRKVVDFWQSLPLRENLVLAPEKVVYEDGSKIEL
ncbi:hypothetical protein Pcinc_010039 [Petrolisthes cinctipes]|uniref:Carboxylic ester hydrolase n=1 Tax=Petrolisthes cinctipes TaxID=88211 RepID=A0AAE1G3K3_PETCI|nr:hypothetical protein Pcinc_010039 [Petrolisthes cinctipes]